MGEQPRFAGVEYPLRPMIAVTADQLPLDRPGGWAFEPKLDGFRCVAFRSLGRVALQSRQQRPLGRYFPEIVAAVHKLAADAVLDGELVVWNDGRLDFAALQRRLHPSDRRTRQLAVALPACFVIFDLLARAASTSVRGPTARGGGPWKKPPPRRPPDGLVLMPMSSEVAVAESWMVDHCAAGIEGRRQAPRPDVPARRAQLAEDPHQDDRRSRRWRRARPARTAGRPDRRLPGC